MRRTLLLLGTLFLALPGIAESLTPREVVQTTADEIILVLRQKQLPLEERRRLIEEIAYSRFDVETISRLVLARHWRRFSPEQREAFVDEMKRHLVVNYGDRLDRYNHEGIEIVGERPEARGDVTVRTRIVGGDGDPLAVDYRLRQRDGERWMVIDVIVEGVSILKSYRSQFQEILANGTPEVLLERLREKNDDDAAAESRSAEDSDAEMPAAVEPAAS